MLIQQAGNPMICPTLEFEILGDRGYAKSLGKIFLVKSLDVQLTPFYAHGSVIALTANNRLAEHKCIGIRNVDAACVCCSHANQLELR